MPYVQEPNNTVKKAPNQLPPEREKELLQAARDIFIEEGLGGSSMDQIARRARMSKTTIYRRYNSKEALFEAVINDEADSVARELQDYSLDVDDPLGSLWNAASAIYEASSSERNVELRRLIIAQARRYPELCQGARDRLTGAANQRLVAFFDTLIARGRMRPVDPTHAALTFSIVMSGGQRPLFNIRHPEAEREQREMNMALFVQGWGIGKDIKK